MDFKKFLEKQRLRIINNKKLTLSGEVNILPGNIGETILMDDELFYKIRKSGNRLNELHPYIEIETVRELHETTIKLFAYNKNFAEVDFISKLNDSLEELLYKMNRLGELEFKLNVYGEVSTLGKIDQFRFVNNNTEVFNKITNTTPRGEVSRALEKMVDRIFGGGVDEKN